MNFNPALHGIRGAAAIYVLLFHWISTYPSTLPRTSSDWSVGNVVRAVLDFGWLGVLLFFVLSGYLLSSKISSRPINWHNSRNFWRRRALRIYPAVWAQFIILTIAAALGVAGLTLPGSIVDGVLNFFLLINLPPYLPRAINLVWWTLPIELCFYLALPLLALLQRKVHWLTLGALALAVSVVWRGFIMYYNRDLPSYMPVHPVIDLLPGALSTFVVGMCISSIPTTSNKKLIYSLVIISFMSILAMCYWLLENRTIYWTDHWMLAVWNPLISIPGGALIYCCLQPTKRVSILRSRPAIWLGDISYGIYLWHFPVLLVTSSYLPQWNNTAGGGLLALATLLFFTLILAQASYTFIEKPAMTRKH